MRDHKLIVLGCRLGFGFFAVYLTVMVAAMLSPAAWDGVMGIVGLRWADFDALPHGGKLNVALLQNMTLCGLIPMAFMAARVGMFGKWTPLDRAFWLFMLGGNLFANGWSVATDSAMAGVIGGDTALVVVLITLAALRRADSPRAAPPPEPAPA